MSVVTFPSHSAVMLLRGAAATAAAKVLWYIRAELKDLASDSLNLLRAAIYDERFPALFDLDVYGSIVGMFELNNLGAQMLTCLGVHTCPILCVRHQKRLHAHSTVLLCQDVR